MDSHTNITAPAGAAMPDFKTAFHLPEDPIYRALKLTKTLDLICELADDDGTPEFPVRVKEVLVFLGREVHCAVDALVDLHVAEHNEHVGRENDHLARQRRAS